MTGGGKQGVFVGVPRAVLDERARRGLATGDRAAGRPSDLDLQMLYRFQVTTHVHTD